MKEKTQTTVCSSILNRNSPDTQHQPCVYLLVNHQNGAIYTGETTCLIHQIWKHKHRMVEGFSKKYDIQTLVWYEMHPTVESALERVKSLKRSTFEVKQALIEQNNPEWRDLYDTLRAEQPDPQQKSA